MYVFNLIYFYNNYLAPAVPDSMAGGEWALADVDFTDVPLGLMPEQSSESLYLIVED